MNTGIYEIERKFLLRDFPECVLDTNSKHMEIRQGWLQGKQLNLRLRESIVSDGTEYYFWGIKIGGGVKRIEIEDEITKEVFDAMWKYTQGKRVSKHRYHVPFVDGLKWEVDRFYDRELYMAEIEMPSEDYQLVVPEWLSKYVVREVTNENEYNNIALAR